MRLWKEKGPAEERAVIVVNTSYQKVPFADAVFAMDEPWWKMYGEHVRANFPGRRVCSWDHASVRHFFEYVPCMNTGNSGAGAIGLAKYWGAKRIVLLGYDCKTGPNGEVHHHGDHPKGLGNAGSMPKWNDHFKSLALRLARAKIEVLNCTRDTALKCWPRADLETVLNASDTQ